MQSPHSTDADCTHTGFPCDRLVPVRDRANLKNSSDADAITVITAAQFESREHETNSLIQIAIPTHCKSFFIREPGSELDRFVSVADSEAATFETGGPALNR